MLPITNSYYKSIINILVIGYSLLFTSCHGHICKRSVGNGKMLFWRFLSSSKWRAQVLGGYSEVCVKWGEQRQLIKDANMIHQLLDTFVLGQPQGPEWLLYIARNQQASAMPLFLFIPEYNFSISCWRKYCSTSPALSSQLFPLHWDHLITACPYQLHSIYQWYR